MAAENQSSEFNQKYQGTYLRTSFDAGQSYKVCLIEQVEQVPNNNSQQFHIQLFDCEHKIPLGNHKRALLTFDFAFPKLGFVNVYDKFPTFLGRKSEKQFKRGPCIQTLDGRRLSAEVFSSIFTANPDICFSAIENQVPLVSVDEKLITTAYNRKFNTFANVVDFLLNPPKEQHKSFSCALSLKWALSMSYNTDYDLILWRELQPVGFVKQRSENLFVVEVADLYFQEWTDYCQRRNVKNVRNKIL